jgi:hypothetical protein
MRRLPSRAEMPDLDSAIRESPKLRRLSHENLPLIATQPKYLALHRHEHALAFPVERPTCSSENSIWYRRPADCAR